jgi:hypothetical protein
MAKARRHGLGTAQAPRHNVMQNKVHQKKATVNNKKKT